MRLKTFYFLILVVSYILVFAVVDLLSQTGDFIEVDNISNILIGVDSSDQRLQLARMNDILLSFLNSQAIVNAKCVLQKNILHMTLTGLLSFLRRRYHNVNVSTMLVFFLKRHILPINKEKTGRDIKGNRTFLKATCGCNFSFKIITFRDRAKFDAYRTRFFK